MAIKLKGTAEFISRIRKVESQVVADLGTTVTAEARTILAASRTRVPVDTGALLASAFTDGPETNPQRASTSATAGYEHEFAGPIHEGVHGAKQLAGRPPHFLRKAVRGARRRFKQAVLQQLNTTLHRFLKK